MRSKEALFLFGAASNSDDMNVVTSSEIAETYTKALAGAAVASQ